MPELPEVEALAAFLRENAVGRVVTRADLAAVQAIKTFDPPLTALGGLEVTGAGRLGKFLDLDVSGLHLVVHLARAGWLHWRTGLPTAPPKPGKGPLALRVHLQDG
ncbi:MAG TPA: DNA-formamidopyrimidine glycosylase family protein, partial [Geodermatophilus sp.]|nr:DNA-formamidopyrimidine glycosylase family protein [Geodermatophilus sp.]